MAVTISGSDGISGDLPTIKVGNGSESAPAVTGQDTDTGLFFGTNEIKVSTGGTAAVTVDSSRQVGIGTTSPAGKLHVSSAGTTRCFIEGSDGKSEIRANNGNLSFFTNQDANASGLNTTVFYRNGANESMRIDTLGALYVGETSGGANRGGTVKAQGYNTRAGVSNSFGLNSFNINWTSPHVQVWIDSVNIGTIATASDYRVKDNIVSITSNCIDRVKQLRPVEFEYTNYGVFSADGVTREGFIAHEVAEAIPSGVDGEKDDPDQIQSLKLDAILSVTVKALQEAVAKIETLETKVAALEAAE